MMIIGEWAVSIDACIFHSSAGSYRISNACSGSTNPPRRRSRGVLHCPEQCDCYHWKGKALWSKILCLGKAHSCDQMKFAFNLMQVIILGTIKISVIFFYRRIFRGRAFDYYSKGMIIIAIAWTIAFFFSVLFECGTHFEYLWSTLLNLVTHCTDEEKFFKAYAISDVIIDVLILAMPIPMVCLRQVGINFAVIDFTNDVRYGGCRCHSSTGWRCVVCS